MISSQVPSEFFLGDHHFLPDHQVSSWRSEVVSSSRFEVNLTFFLQVQSGEMALSPSRSEVNLASFLQIRSEYIALLPFRSEMNLSFVLQNLRVPSQVLSDSVPGPKWFRPASPKRSSISSSSSEVDPNLSLQAQSVLYFPAGPHYLAPCQKWI